MKRARPVPAGICNKCKKPYPTKEFFLPSGKCIVCDHLEKQIAANKK